ncbi:hypothetical protein EYF80_049200 [Liparis tanakae]|uniref:Uncharacterized protein n=1 Tax=Liparis tanakae TaxID=230148 RepID=A0A4Z2FHC1_9TELE|nr:hypothetical protein EYF80_049200 [Liparis tanakae]
MWKTKGLEPITWTRTRRLTAHRPGPRGRIELSGMHILRILLTPTSATGGSDFGGEQLVAYSN